MTVGEERRTAHRPRPLSSGIGRRYELRVDLGGSAKCRVVKGGQIFLHGAAGGRGITRLAPFRARDRPLLVGVRHNQAGIDCEAVAADQACRQARLDDTLEHMAEEIAIAEPLVAGTRERRMVGDLGLDAQTAEPAIGQVHLHLAAQRPFRADREHVADEEHPDHEHRIDRRTAHPRVKGPQLGVDPGQRRSGEPDNRPERPHRGRTNRTAVPGSDRAAPSSLAPAYRCLNTRESAFDDLSKRLLQQNLPTADSRFVTARETSTIIQSANE